MPRSESSRTRATGSPGARGPAHLVAGTCALEPEDWILLTGIFWVAGFGMMIALWIEARWRFRKLFAPIRWRTCCSARDQRRRGECTYADVYVKAGARDPPRRQTKEFTSS